MSDNDDLSRAFCKDLGRPPRVIVYRVGSLGDALVVLPAFHLVRTVFPRGHITLLTNFPVNAKAAPMEAVLKSTGLYDDTLRYPTSLRDWRKLAELRRKLREARYDWLVYLAKPKGGFLASVRDYLFFRACGIRRIVGVPFSRHDLQCEQIAGTELFTSETVRTINCLRKLGTPDLTESRWWDLQFTPAELDEAEALLSRNNIATPFVAASVGTKMQSKDWEETNWVAFGSRLSAAYPNLPLVLFGVEEERERSERLMNVWAGPKLNLCGRVSPRVSAAVMRGAALMVCHDSGPMHLAATVGVPCVAIFSARAKPGEWYPRGENHRVIYRRTPCWNCGLEECREYKKVCILSISVEEVVAAAEQKLSEQGIVSGL